MSSNEDNTYFRELGLREKKSKLARLVDQNGTVMVWKKGDNKRELYERLSMAPDSLEIQLSGAKTKYDKQDVLYTFELKGVHYFGKGKISKASNYGCFLDCQNTLYKRERRENFRLLTYPHHKIFVHINMNYFGEESNIIDINTQMSQTGLFKSFVKLINDDDETPLREGHVCCRVVDISVKGLGVHVSEIEKNYLEENPELGKLFIDFKGEEIEIEEAKVIYSIPIAAQDPNVELFKVGIKFLNVDDYMEKELGKKITDTLSEYTSDFEDFIK